VHPCPALIVSRSKGLFPLGKWLLRFLRVRGVVGTALEGDELNRLINRLKPLTIFFDASFYEDITARRIGLLLRDFPYLNIAVFSLNYIRPEKAVYFKLYGAKSYFDLSGSGMFWRALKLVVKGKSYVTPAVQAAYENMADVMPDMRFDTTAKQEDVKLLIFKGYRAKEIAGIMGVSEKTVEFHKRALFGKYGVESALELFRACYLNGELDRAQLTA
jgi:DNA-binding NarL/FixJ family response regulator